MDVVSLAERPDLAVAAFEIPYADDAPRFMRASMIAALVRRRRMSARWPDHVLVGIDTRGTPVARGVMVPFRAHGDERQRFPDGGWDQVAIWAAEDALDDTTPDTNAALEIAIHPDHHGRGLSHHMLTAMRRHTHRHGHSCLVAPARPPGKAAEPFVPMADYAARTRPDGLPADRWLRAHARAGATITAIASASATVHAPLDRWRDWTGLPFDRDGGIAVPGALAPVLVSTALDTAVYVEPNVWLRHDC